MMPTDFTDGQEFRFLRFGTGPDIYLAIRQDALWRVTLEGSTAQWMYWLLSDVAVLKSCWDHRLTD
jgi:hypothetical protein